MRYADREKTMGIVLYLLMGALAGWIAGNIMKDRSFGLVGNVVVGVVGGILGGFLFGMLGIGTGGLIGSLITAVIGAVVLLWLVGLVKK